MKEILSTFFIKLGADFRNLQGRVIQILSFHSNSYHAPESLKSNASIRQARAEDPPFSHPDPRRYCHEQEDSKKREAFEKDEIAWKEKREKISLEIKDVASTIYGFISRRYWCLFRRPSREDPLEIGKGLDSISSHLNNYNKGKRDGLDEDDIREIEEKKETLRSLFIAKGVDGGG